jgi:hypothetical protein
VDRVAELPPSPFRHYLANRCQSSAKVEPRANHVRNVGRRKAANL